MDMANATAAGPSEGLLDVLFGSKPAEPSEADGKDFTNLLDAIKSLGKKATEAAKEEQSRWTQVEMEAGKDLDERQVDGSSVLALMIGMAGQNMSQSPIVVSQDGQSEKGSVNQITGSRSQMAQGKNSLDLGKRGLALLTLQEGDVNGLLKEQNMEPLDAKEQALLKQINSKLRASAGNGKKGDAKLEGLDPKQLQGDIISVEASGLERKAGAAAATESFLKLRNLANELQANRTDGKSLTKPDGKEVDGAKDAKGNPISGLPKNDLETVLPKGPKEHGFSSAFGGAPLVMNELKSTDVEFKEVLLNGVKPQERAGALMQEVSQSVNFQALKGGGEMRLVIYPESLGEIHLKVGTRNGKVEVKMTAQNEEVASMIRDGAADLAGALRENNLELSKFEVNFSEKTFGVDTKIEARDPNPSSMFDQRHQPNMNQQHEGRSNNPSQFFQDQEANRQPDFGRAYSEPKASAAKPMYKPARSSKTTSLDVVA